MRRTATKNIVMLAVAILLVFVQKTPSHAGDIPESIKTNARADVVFCEVLSCDGTIRYRAAQKGDQVLVAIETNDTGFDIYEQLVCEIDGYEPETVTLATYNKFTQRLQTYLNDGWYDNRPASSPFPSATAPEYTLAPSPSPSPALEVAVSTDRPAWPLFALLMALALLAAMLVAVCAARRAK